MNPQLILKAILTDQGQVKAESAIIDCDVLQAIKMLAALQNDVLIRFKRAGLSGGMSMDELIDSTAATAKTTIETDTNRLNLN
jgi:hypothetical protein